VFGLSRRFRVFAYRRPVDMRKSFNTLSALVLELGHDVIAGDAYPTRLRAFDVAFVGFGVGSGDPQSSYCSGTEGDGIPILERYRPGRKVDSGSRLSLFRRPEALNENWGAQCSPHAFRNAVHAFPTRAERSHGQGWWGQRGGRS
jgi:hypothetical protein